MDDLLKTRFEVYRNQDDIDCRIVEFVREYVQSQWDDSAQTDERVGSFVSHLIMALNRARLGGAVEEGPGQMALDEVTATHPCAFAQATTLSHLVKVQLDLALDPREVDFLAVHLATFSLFQGDSAQQEGR